MYKVTASFLITLYIYDVSEKSVLSIKTTHVVRIFFWHIGTFGWSFARHDVLILVLIYYKIVQSHKVLLDHIVFNICSRLSILMLESYIKESKTFRPWVEQWIQNRQGQCMIFPSWGHFWVSFSALTLLLTRTASSPYKHSKRFSSRQISHTRLAASFPEQPSQAGIRKVKAIWILTKQEMMGWQWHQLDHMQVVCTSLQPDNHASTSSLNF